MYDQMKDSDKAQAKRLIAVILAAGYKVSVNDGEEWVLIKSTDADAIYEAIGSTDSDTLKIRTAHDTLVGSMWLVWGNGPRELVSDYTDNDATTALWEDWQAAEVEAL